MPDQPGSRFDSIEEAHDFVGVLRQIVEETEAVILEEAADADRNRAGRQLDALRLVSYKLSQLNQHLASSSRLLNDLRTLRRALYGERKGQTTPV
jgi:hypothetical protein